MPSGSNLSLYLKSAKKWLQDLFFPIACLDCGREGEWLCGDCRKALEYHRGRFCPVCKKEKDDCQPCESCQEKSFLKGLWIISDYDEKIKKIISGIKYNFIEELAEYWDKLIEDYFKLKQDWPKEAILIPVPLHAKRLLERGFNQSELICEALARVYGNEIKTGIVWRAVNSKPQAKLKSAERKGNVRGIFKVNKGIKIDKLRGKKIVLIDDVYTTGATMEECAKTLKEAGIKEIWGLALARGA